MNNLITEYVCVINLDSRPDRWMNMRSQLPLLGIRNAHRFSAISSEKLKTDPPENFKKAILSGLSRKSESWNADHQIRAMWGCLNSHLGVIEYAKSNSWPYVLILEDDCEFEPYARKVINSIEEQLSVVDWDMLYLGGSIRGGSVKNVSKNLQSVQSVNLAHAYVLNSKVFNKILKDAPISGMTIDDYYRKVLQKEIVTLITYPMVAYQRNGDISDISQAIRGRKYNLKKLVKSFMRVFNRLRYKLSF